MFILFGSRKLGFFTKSVRFGRTELSLRLSKCSWRDLAIEKGFRACFLKNKKEKYDCSYGLEVEQQTKHICLTPKSSQNQALEPF